MTVSALEFEWREWRLREGRYKGYTGPRPTRFPRVIPLVWWTRLALFLAARRQAALSPVWQQDGVFVRALSSFTGIYRDPARAAGFKWIAVQLANAPWVPANELELARIRGTLEANGWLIVGWGTGGQSDRDPTAEGYEAGRITGLLRLAGWITNHEVWSEGPDAWKSRAWLDGWRQSGCKAPLAVSCLSSDTGNYPRAFDYNAWLSVPGCAVMPQVYGASWPTYTVAAMKANLATAGVSLTRVAPTFEVINGAGPFSDYSTWRGPRSIWTGDDSRAFTWKSLTR